jgi:hypothetical protein
MINQNYQGDVIEGGISRTIASSQFYNKRELREIKKPY